MSKHRWYFVSKEVIYDCGCKVTIDGWRVKDADVVCKEHGEPIKKIITTTKYFGEVR